VALASHHWPLPWLLRLTRGWRWRRSSTGDEWRREELNRRRGRRRSRRCKLQPRI
jgi:hypothetical protein